MGKLQLHGTKGKTQEEVKKVRNFKPSVVLTAICSGISMETVIALKINGLTSQIEKLETLRNHSQGRMELAKAVTMKSSQEAPMHKFSPMVKGGAFSFQRLF